MDVNHVCMFAGHLWIQPIGIQFIYNKLYIKDLISDGYRVKSVENGTIAELEKELGLVFDR